MNNLLYLFKSCRQVSIAFGLLALLSLNACNNNKNDFDRKPFLENMGNNVIIPAYKQAHEKAQILKTAIADFTTAPDAAKLQTAKNAFKETYLAWQHIEFFDFGKAVGLALSINNFPTDTAKISTNIATGTYNLNQAGNVSAKGFPALDFLLFSKDETSTINDVNNTQYAKQYWNDVANDISTNIASVYDDWNTAYLNTFVSATGLDMGSSTSILCNAWAEYTERTRRERVGNALGYIGLVGSGNINPKFLEGFYSDFSKELLVANLEAGKDIFTGKGGASFKDFPQLADAEFQGTPLSDEIGNQYDKCIAATLAISSDFKTALVSENVKMEALFLELKKLTVLVKVDLSSVVGVTINYVDNDGD